MDRSLVRTRVTTTQWAVLLSALGLTIHLEAVLQLPLRLPGHRVLPGALTLLLFAEALAPALLLVFAVAVPFTLTLAGAAPGWAVAAWAVPALLVVWSADRSFRKSLLWFAAVGLLFGLARYLSLGGFFHKTPAPIRLFGHLGFGLFGGGGAWTLAKLMFKDDKDD